VKPEDINFWSMDPTQSSHWLMSILAVVVGFVFMFVLMQVPTQARRYIVGTLTFLAGGVFVLAAYWPKPINFDAKTQVPSNTIEGVGSFLGDATSVVGTFTQILAAFMLGLGIFSLLRIHLNRIARQRQDWGFSIVLLVSMISMIVFGYWDYNIRLADKLKDYDVKTNWEFANMARDFLFEGLLQQMDAAMFSIIAFFILSAAYRAFRARSVEATILLGTALLVILSLMGVVASAWDNTVDGLAKDNEFIKNFRITDIASWVKNTFQTPAITGIKFGIGLGTLSMALRIWLGLERGGKS
jgi:hypothetical protein